MAYCGPHGIPLSTFLAWPEEDQQAALAWQAHEGRRCRSCGTHPEDFPNGGRGPNEVHFHPRWCVGCQQLEQAQVNLGEDRGKPGVAVVPVSGPARACPTCNPPKPTS